MARFKRLDALTPTLMLLAGAGLSYVAALLMRRRKSDASCDSVGKAGSVPHTDFDAAAKIGRETGGEVFDD